MTPRENWRQKAGTQFFRMEMSGQTWGIGLAMRLAFHLVLGLGFYLELGFDLHTGLGLALGLGLGFALDHTPLV